MPPKPAASGKEVSQPSSALRRVSSRNSRTGSATGPRAQASARSNTPVLDMGQNAAQMQPASVGEGLVMVRRTSASKPTVGVATSNGSSEDRRSRRSFAPKMSAEAKETQRKRKAAREKSTRMNQSAADGANSRSPSPAARTSSSAAGPSRRSRSASPYANGKGKSKRDDRRSRSGSPSSRSPRGQPRAGRLQATNACPARYACMLTLASATGIPAATRATLRGHQAVALSQYGIFLDGIAGRAMTREMFKAVGFATRMLGLLEADNRSRKERSVEELLDKYATTSGGQSLCLGDPRWRDMIPDQQPWMEHIRSFNLRFIQCAAAALKIKGGPAQPALPPEALDVIGLAALSAGQDHPNQGQGQQLQNGPAYAPSRAQASNAGQVAGEPVALHKPTHPATNDTGEDWSVIDRFPATQALDHPFRLSASVPKHLREQWRHAWVTVLTWHKEAKTDSADRTADTTRALKWFLLLPHLLLRLPRRGGKRGRAAMNERFEFFRTKRFDFLIACYQRDCTSPRSTQVYSRLTGGAGKSKTERAMECLETQRAGDARRACISHGMGDPFSPSGKAQMIAKHPPAAHPLLDLEDYDFPDEPGHQYPSCRDFIRNLPRNKGAGPSGMKNELMIQLIANDGATDKVCARLDEFIADYLEGEMPDWYYEVVTAINLVALRKEPGSEDLRPVGVGDVVRRLANSMLVSDQAEKLHEATFPQQVAVCTPGGPGCLVYTVRGLLDQNADFICIKVDVENFHNSFSRHRCLEAIAKAANSSPSMRALGRLGKAFHHECRHAGRMYSGGRRFPANSESGGNQGDNKVAAAAGLVLQDSICSAHYRVSKKGGVAMGQADDVYIVGPPAEAYAAFEEYFNNIGDKTGCNVRKSKSAVYCRSSLRDIPDTRKRLQLDLLTRDVEGTAHPGMVISGIPIGPPTDQAFELAVYTEIVDRIESDLQTINDTLLSHSPMAVYTIMQKCVSQQFYHWLQLGRPDTVGKVLPRLQAVIDQSLAASTFADNPAVLQADVVVRDRTRLPLNEAGFGMRVLADVHPAAYLGAFWQVLPRLVASTVGGLETMALAPGLEAVLGAGPFDEAKDGVDCVKGLLDSDHPWAAEYRWAWTECCKDMPPEALADGPLSGRIEDSANSHRHHGQHAITHRRETVAVARYAERMKLLAHDDLRRMSWETIRGSTTAKFLVSSYPDRHFNFRPDEWAILIEVYFGLPPSIIKHLVGQQIKGVTRRRRTDGTLPQYPVMDRHGAELWAAVCKDGGLPTIRHDEVKWAIEEVFSALEHRVTVEVEREFSRFLPAAGVGDLGSQRVIPDIKIWATPKILADVKGITMSKTRYLNYTLQSNEYAPGFAVQQRQRAVHTDVKRHLKKLDDKYNAAAPGGGAAPGPALQGAGAAPGPLVRHLTTYGKVKGFVFGWFGEISSDLDQAVCAATKQAVKRIFAQTAAQSPDQAEAALVHNSRRVLAAGILRANVSFIVERLPFASAEGTQAALRRTHARARVFREGDPATVTYDHYRSRVNAPGSWRDITPCH